MRGRRAEGRRATAGSARPGGIERQGSGLGLTAARRRVHLAVVDCTRCGRRNPPHVRYCLDCGARLEAPPAQQNVCDACTTNNPLDARFCRECGALLGAATEPGSLPQPGMSSQGGAPFTPAPYASHLLDLDEPASSLEVVQPSPRELLPAAQPRTETSKRCQRCGGYSSPRAAFCQFCGTTFDSEPPAEESRPATPARERSDSGTPAPKAELVVIAQDGSPGRRYPIAGPEMTIGSQESCGIALRRDPYVCPEHARITYRNGGFSVEDLSPVNGVFVRIGGSVPLKSGDLLLLGLAVLFFEVMEEPERHLSAAIQGGVRVFGTPPSPRYARLSLKSVENAPRDVYYLSRAETVLGREVGDIVFTDDPFMSRRHAAIRRDPASNQFSLRDLGSSNGTFVAIRGRHAISHGDHIRVGQHLFRLDVRRGE